MTNIDTVDLLINARCYKNLSNTVCLLETISPYTATHPAASDQNGRRFIGTPSTFTKVLNKSPPPAPPLRVIGLITAVSEARPAAPYPRAPVIPHPYTPPVDQQLSTTANHFADSRRRQRSDNVTYSTALIAAIEANDNVEICGPYVNRRRWLRLPS